MDNPEKLTTLGTQDADKQKNTTQYMLETTMGKQTKKYNTIYVGHHYAQTNTE
jgi:hypothetical protein